MKKTWMAPVLSGLLLFAQETPLSAAEKPASEKVQTADSPEDQAFLAKLNKAKKMKNKQKAEETIQALLDENPDSKYAIQAKRTLKRLQREIKQEEEMQTIQSAVQDAMKDSDPANGYKTLLELAVQYKNSQASPYIQKAILIKQEDVVKSEIAKAAAAETPEESIDILNKVLRSYPRSKQAGQIKVKIREYRQKISEAEAAAAASDKDKFGGGSSGSEDKDDFFGGSDFGKKDSSGSDKDPFGK